MVGVYIGFDQPKSLGTQEQGASAALPVFIDIMTEALADQPATPFRVPAGVRLVRVDAETGLLPGPDTDAVILEAFMPGTEPTAVSPPRGATASIHDAIDSGSADARPRAAQRAADRRALLRTRAPAAMSGAFPRAPRSCYTRPRSR